MGFSGGRHLLFKAMADAQVKFPADRDEIKKALSGRTIQTSDGEYSDAGRLAERLPQKEFECASAFWCAYTAILSTELKKGKGHEKELF